MNSLFYFEASKGVGYFRIHIHFKGHRLGQGDSTGVVILALYMADPGTNPSIVPEWSVEPWALPGVAHKQNNA